MAVRLKNTSDRPKAIRVPGKILTVDPGKEISVTAKLSDEYRKRLAEVGVIAAKDAEPSEDCLLYTSPSPRDATLSRMPSSA